MFFAPAADRIGTIKAWSGAAVPAGWLDCNGAAVSRSTYAALFSEIGTSYGVGDGANTFNVPDFRGRSIVGAGTGSGLTARSRGQAGGAEVHSLAGSENGLHSHDRKWGDVYGYPTGAPAGGYGVDFVAGHQTGDSGTGAAHNNMSPFGVAFWIIKA